MPGKPGQHELTLSLAATTSPVNVGGYRLSQTDNYNGGYLPTTVELKAGDTLKIRLLNTLSPNNSASSMHGAASHRDSTRSTNLHTHGLIVSPNNATRELPQNGDNIFVALDRGQSLDYNIEIPTALPASLLDGKSGIIPHPSGPFWYHSHQHGSSATQVSGGMSGLLSIGPRDINLVATKPTETAALRAKTDISYLMLRDIQITSATDPIVADGSSPAIWTSKPDTKLCEADADTLRLPAIEQRDGYCQDPKDKSKIWLFTVNGQRFPTIKISSGRNNLWRLANLSASATYVIRLINSSGKPVRFSLISVDGVVPGIPKQSSVQPTDTPEADAVDKLLLMPAARAEIFIKNDNGDAAERRLILKTEGVNSAATGPSGDRWPEIKLAEVILEGAPTIVAGAVRVGLNQYVARAGPPTGPTIFGAAPAPALPRGCVRDINRAAREHRRIMFAGSGPWFITTDIVHPKDKTKLQRFDEFEADPSASLSFVGFDQYLKPDHTVDWDASDGRPRHTCVRLSNGHSQLWELNNPTAEVHNFHLHQTKFRLAREEDLKDYGIDPSSLRVKSGLEVKAPSETPVSDRNVWHDTLPIMSNETIFIVINFDAEEQVGRYVFHCHILKHEDEGLMAPIEVLR